ncbi:MAG TPA: restriction endonuclease [Thermomicrobiales bacterium]
MKWIRRHPIASIFIAIILGLYILVVALSDTPGTASLAGAVLFIPLVAFTLLLTWIWAKLRRKPETSERSGATVIASAATAPSPPPAPGPVIAPIQPAAAPPVQQEAVWRPVLAPTLGDLLMLEPAQFEDLTARVLTAIGFRDVKRVGGAGDLGADLTCRDLQGRLTIVQCKRFAPGSTVGTPVVQTIIGMQVAHHQAERSIVVTTSTFTVPAIELAQRHGVALIDGDSLRLLIHLTGVPVAPPTQRTHIYCRQCGTQNSVNERFCAACGAPLGRLSTTSQS